MTTLVYVGTNVGNSLWEIFDKYDSVYAFEADPEIFIQLNRRFKQFEWVTLVNAACSEFDGEQDFYVTPNRVSSSLADASSYEKESGCPEILKKITVKTINLGKYLKDNNVKYIDYYLSDIQGSDLNVLKTIKDFIDSKNIGELFLETHGNKIFIYDNLYNQFDGFKEILSENYEFVHASLGRLNGQLVSENEIPEGEKEWDSYWKLK
jgi:FkbM family methyltransferase